MTMIRLVGIYLLITFFLALTINSLDIKSSSNGKLVEQGTRSFFNDLARYRNKRDSAAHFEMRTNDCGSRRSCYVSLKTCDVDPKTCYFVLSWDYDGEYINYELTGLSQGWVSVLFSSDATLGKDHLVVCSKRQNSAVDVTHYFKESSESELQKYFYPTLFKESGDYHPDGYINCKFSLKKTDDSTGLDFTKSQYVYVERGGGDEPIGEKIQSGFYPSDTKVEFPNSVYVPRSERSWLIKVHAILAIIAWIFLGSVGILMARYYKPLWPNHVMYSFRVWFSFHRPIMFFVTLLTLLSFLFALIEMDWGWSVDGHDLTHAILGLIVIICSLINPILGFLRPKPQTKLRCCFFWFHWLIGAVAYCLAVPTIFIGMDLRKSDLPNWCAWLLFAWVIFHIIVEIILEIHYCCTFNQVEGNLNEYNMDYDKNNKNPDRVLEKKRDPPGKKWKPALFFIYTIVTAIVVCCLVIAIVVFDI